MFKKIIVIPARYASTRLPAKPLLDICGKPMIQHVYERSCLVKGVDHVVVATDNQEIFEVVISFGGNVIMTSDIHESGTDRIAEVSRHIESEWYINIQGDEPLIEPEDIEILIKGIEEKEKKGDSSMVASLYHIMKKEDIEDINKVKVVLDEKDRALYFSRSVIPYNRSEESVEYKRHLGVYAYKKELLNIYSNLSVCELEKIEKLEQLRLLNNGYSIDMFKVKEGYFGVDTPECLIKVRAIMQEKINKGEF